MKTILNSDRWSPYLAGFLLAVLATLSFLFTGRLLGTTSALARIPAAIWYIFDPSHLEQNSYYTSLLQHSAWINPQVALVIGILIGSYIAGALFGKSPIVHVPEIWRQSFGPSRLKRYIGAFIGGVIIMYGARLAGGCTSGHAISGGMQLATTSWIFMISFFATGVPTALILYKTKKQGKSS